MQFLGAEAALKLLDKARISQGRRKSVSEMDGLPDPSKLTAALGERSTLPGCEVMKMRPKSSDLLLNSSGPTSKNESKEFEALAATTLQKERGQGTVRVTIHSLTAQLKNLEYNLSNEKLATILEKAFAAIVKDRLRDHAARHQVPWQQNE